MSIYDNIHLGYNEKLDLLQQVMSLQAAEVLADEIDSYSFARLRDLRDIIHTIAQGRKER